MNDLAGELVLQEWFSEGFIVVIFSPSSTFFTVTKRIAGLGIYLNSFPLKLTLDLSLTYLITSHYSPTRD